MNLQTFLQDTGLCDTQPNSLALDFYAYLLCIHVDEVELKKLAWTVFATRYPDHEQPGTLHPDVFKNFLLHYEKGMSITADKEIPTIPGSHAYGELLVGYTEHKKHFPELVEAGYFIMSKVSGVWHEGQTIPVEADEVHDSISTWYKNTTLSTQKNIGDFNTSALARITVATDLIIASKLDAMGVTYQEFLDGTALHFNHPVMTERLKFVLSVSNTTPNSKILQRIITGEEIHEFLTVSGSTSYVALYKYVVNTLTATP